MVQQDDLRARSRLPQFAGSIAAALFLCDAGAAAAQDAIQVSGLVVKKEAPEEGYKADEPSLVKLTQPLIDTPQMISVTPQQVIEDRGATSLTDVFRNSSGISLGAGESSWNGTNLSIRGFNARNDMYLDGMRDFGSYTRDPFDLEEVEVLQGPSSVLFGRGSTGGVVNQVSKAPTLHGFMRMEATGGTDDMARGTIDVDLPLNGATAVRLAGVAHTQDFTDRDIAKATRYGLAPSIAFGLGTASRLTLSYLYQSEGNIPDYGLPYLRGAPAPVPRNNFYGFESDYFDAQANVATAKYEHDISDHVTFRDQLRFADYSRDWRDIEPQVNTTGVTASTPISAIQVNRALQGGSGKDTFLQNQMDVIASFSTGGIQHTLAAGWEAGPESARPTYDNALGVPGTSLLTPNEGQAFSGVVYPRVTVNTDANTLGAYLIDTLKFGSQWELTGGWRWDRFRSHYVAQFYGNTLPLLNTPTTSQDVREDDQKPSWRGSLVYKPATNGSIYFDYSTSFNPSAEQLSQIVAVRSFSTSNVGLAPEENQTFEVGTKWNLFSHRLQLQAAAFREEKQNAREPDPANSAFNILAGDIQVDGAELELAGKLTDGWQASVSYTYLDGRTVKSVAGGPAVGSPLFNAPRNSLALWTIYQITPRIQVGGGVNYLSRRYTSLTTNPYTSVPGYTTVDLMAKWRINDRVRLQVNVNNLTDKYYYDQVHGFHVAPGEGRTALFTLAYSH